MKLRFSFVLLVFLFTLHSVAAAQDYSAADKNGKVNPAMEPIQDVAGLPRVLLIGDSISIGYTLPTRSLLAGKANVHRIPENGGDTSNGLKKLDSWLGSGKWDVIHFNFGLHDLKFVEGHQPVPLAQYEKNLTELVKRLKATGAKVIWRSTTPVPEGNLNPPRKSADVISYNQVAQKIMRENRIAIDDLYGFAFPRVARIQLSVNVHFTPEGSQLLAQHVAASIEAVLPKHSLPTDGWRTATPESQGVDSGILADAIDLARQRGLAIHSFLLIRNGVIVAEAYFYPYDGKTPHDIASVTKPITATLIGLAIEQGKIKSVKEPMLSLFSGQKIANVDERKQRVFVEHLLTMSSGLACKAQAGEPTLWEMLSAPDNTQFMRDLPMVDEPGSKYIYCSGGMHLLSGAIKQKTGMNAEAFARKNLFGPLGISNLVWPRDPQNISHGFGNLHLLPRDMAKLGWLFLKQGQWNGKQIVPAAWVADATRSHIKTGGAGSSDYGYGWRVPTNGGLIAFEASGRGGQQISVLPAKNAVIVMNGGGFSAGEVIKLALSALKSDQPLPENPTALARLNNSIAAIAKSPAPQAVTALPAVAQSISGKKFELEKNWMGLKSLALSFRPGDETATATLEFEPALKQYQWGLSAKVRGAKTVSEVRPVGLNGVPRFSNDGIMGIPVALKGAWEDAQTFALEYDEVANTNTYRLRLTFDGNRVSVQAKERTGLFDEKFSGVAH